MNIELVDDRQKVISLTTDRRIIVIAGPNGVGKSNLLRTISGRYEPRRHFTGAQRYPGFYVDRVKYNTHLISPDNLKDMSLHLGANMPLPPASFAESEYGNVKAAIEQPEAEGDIPQIKEIRKLITAADRQAYAQADMTAKQKVISGLQTRAMKPSRSAMSSVFMAYHREYASRRYKGEEREAIIQAIGTPPWEQVQRDFNELGIPYSIATPDIDRDMPGAAPFIMRRRAGDGYVEGDHLSSGERVALSLYDFVSASSNQPRAFLFDDIDAFMHPPLMRRFLQVLERILEQQNSVAVLVTHNPVLVQLCGSVACYFIPEYDADLVPIERAALVQQLSAGELVIAENFGTVFVEGADVGFYNDVFTAMNIHNVISVRRQVKFVSPRSNQTGADASCAAVNDIVNVLASHGYADRFMGLIDLDRGRLQRHENVFALARYCKENYFFDPLNIYAYCLDNDPDCLPNLPKFPGLGLGMSHRMVATLGTEGLQAVVDHFFQRVCNNADFASRNPESLLGDRIPIRLSTGEEISYPPLFIAHSGKHLMQPFANMHRNLQRERLSHQFLKGAYWPADLVETMQRFC